MELNQTKFEFSDEKTKKPLGECFVFFEAPPQRDHVVIPNLTKKLMAYSRPKGGFLFLMELNQTKFEFSDEKTKKPLGECFVFFEAPPQRDHGVLPMNK